LNRKDFDAAELDNCYFSSLIRKGDVVINCVGILKPYISDTGRANTIKINSVFPQMIADICELKQAWMVHISSDCIFSGEKGKYTEKDIPDAGDLYGRTKSIEPSSAAVIRTSFIGEDSREKGVGLLEWILSHTGQVTGYENCYWNGVTCLQLAKIIECMIRRNHWWRGIRHIYSNETVNKYQLCKDVLDIYERDLPVKAIQATEIEGTQIDGYLDRSLLTMHRRDGQPTFNIPTLIQQISEQKNYG